MITSIVPNYSWVAYIYHERVIRDNQILAAIWEYILYNLMKWAEDSENPVNSA